MDLKTAALLNPNDPERLRLEQDICQTPEGREAWLQAMHEAEQLRVQLKTATASSAAVSRALQISRNPSRAARKTPRYIGMAAAAAIICLGGWWGVTQHHTKPTMVAATTNHQEIRTIKLTPEIRQLSLLAMQNFHERDRTLTSARNVETLLTNLDETRHFPTQVPQLGPLQQLVGGKIVTLDNQPALLTRWTETVEQGQIHDVVLQQTYASNLNLPENMNPVLVHIAPPEKTDRIPCDVLVWSKDGIVHLLVSNSSDGCAKRALQALREKMGEKYPQTANAV